MLGSDWLSAACLALAGLGCAYALLAAALVARHARRASPRATAYPSVTLLKPLHGREPGLYANLASFCAQDYPGPLQIVFGVQDPHDPALAVVERLRAEFPERQIEIVVDGRVHGANRKVSNLVNMAVRLRHDMVVLADSDIRVEEDHLRRVVDALDAPGVGLVTCLYHGLPEANLWSRLSALGVDGGFLPNAVVGVALGLTDPCFGSTIALRRDTLDAVGGFAAFADRLADDYAIGEAVRLLGHRVAIPGYTVGHACPQGSRAELARHELRWARTIRSIDPLGYAGSVITHPLPFALLGALLAGLTPVSLGVVVAAIAVRLSLHRTVARAFRLTPQPWFLIPLRDLVSVAVFAWSFFGDDVRWRGHGYRVRPDGTLNPDLRSRPT